MIVDETGKLMVFMDETGKLMAFLSCSLSFARNRGFDGTSAVSEMFCRLLRF